MKGRGGMREGERWLEVAGSVMHVRVRGWALYAAVAGVIYACETGIFDLQLQHPEHPELFRAREIARALLSPLGKLYF